jgi:lysophospholipase L1-like esterase
MQAMNGSGVYGIRRVSSFVGCVAAVLALAALIVPSIASAHAPKKTYLALGDSLAFGYSQELFNNNLAVGDPASAFEHGYASDYFGLLKAGQYQYVNDGCPGETSASLIGNGTLGKAIQSADPAVSIEAPCAYHNEDGLPLHHEYGGTKSQLESALETIAVDQSAGKPVKVVTLDIGANDQLHAIGKLKAEVTAQITTKVTDLATAEGERYVRGKLEAYAKPRVEQWVGEVLIPQVIGEHYAEIHGYAQKECEKVSEEDYATPAYWEAICASPYPEDPELTVEQAYEFGYVEAVYLPGETPTPHAGVEPYPLDITNKGAYYEGEDEYLNKTTLEEEGQAYAETWAAEYQVNNKAQLEAEGGEKLIIGLIAVSPELDKQIITNASAIIETIKKYDSKAKVIFVGTYNAYGNDYGTGELLPHSNELLAALAAAESSTFKHKPMKACFVDMQSLFNVGGSQEVTNMLTWTNMHNTNEFEYAVGKKLKFDEEVEVAPGDVLKADGPDIHATPTGYTQMAGYIHSHCVA